MARLTGLSAKMVADKYKKVLQNEKMCDDPHDDDDDDDDDDDPRK